MQEIQKHYYKKQWYKDIEFNIEPLEDVYNKVGEKLFKPHRLDFHQFLFIVEGEGEHEVDFETLQLEKNSLVPVVIGQIQSYKKLQNLKGYVVVFTSNFLIHDKVNLKYLYNFTTFNSLLKPQYLKCSSEVGSLIEMLHDAFCKKNTFEYEEVLRSYLKLIILKYEQSKRDLVDAAVYPSIELNLRFNQVLENHVSYKTKITELCKELHVDGKKLSAALKVTTNKTPKQLLDERIVLELKRLFSYTDLSIKEIANMLGFEEASNLTNYFKKRTACTPSEFRASINKH